MNINDLGLRLLSWVKNVKGDSVDLKSIQMDERPIMQHDQWTDLLRKYVTPTGEVNYEGFIEEEAQLQEYLDDLSNHTPGSNWSENQKMAYWINAYNAFTVKLVMNHYPLKSIKDIGDGLPMISSPWDIKFFKIGALDFDLNTIEHEILRKQFTEPRIHFAINCASFSCPRLRNEAFVAASLDQQLDEQTLSFIKNPKKNSISSSETKLSKIFNWFEADFNKKSDVLTFIKNYEPSLNVENKIEYIDYDWSLNQ